MSSKFPTDLARKLPDALAKRVVAAAVREYENERDRAQQAEAAIDRISKRWAWLPYQRIKARAFAEAYLEYFAARYTVRPEPEPEDFDAPSDPEAPAAPEATAPAPAAPEATAPAPVAPEAPTAPEATEASAWPRPYIIGDAEDKADEEALQRRSAAETAVWRAVHETAEDFVRANRRALPRDYDAMQPSTREALGRAIERAITAEMLTAAGMGPRDVVPGNSSERAGYKAGFGPVAPHKAVITLTHDGSLSASPEVYLTPPDGERAKEVRAVLRALPRAGKILTRTTNVATVLDPADLTLAHGAGAFGLLHAALSAFAASKGIEYRYLPPQTDAERAEDARAAARTLRELAERRGAEAQALPDEARARLARLVDRFTFSWATRRTLAARSAAELGAVLRDDLWRALAAEVPADLREEHAIDEGTLRALFAPVVDAALERARAVYVRAYGEPLSPLPSRAAPAAPEATAPAPAAPSATALVPVAPEAPAAPEAPETPAAPEKPAQTAQRARTAPKYVTLPILARRATGFVDDLKSSTYETIRREALLGTPRVEASGLAFAPGDIEQIRALLPFAEGWRGGIFTARYAGFRIFCAKGASRLAWVARPIVLGEGYDWGILPAESYAKTAWVEGPYTLDRAPLRGDPELFARLCPDPADISCAFALTPEMFSALNADAGGAKHALVSSPTHISGKSWVAIRAHVFGAETTSAGGVLAEAHGTPPDNSVFLDAQMLRQGFRWFTRDQKGVRAAAWLWRSAGDLQPAALVSDPRDDHFMRFYMQMPRL